jgi:hypothetical protein
MTMTGIIFCVKWKATEGFWTGRGHELTNVLNYHFSCHVENGVHKGQERKQADKYHNIERLWTNSVYLVLC